MTRYRGWDSANTKLFPKSRKNIADSLKQQLAASVKAVKKNKYGAKRVQVDNIWFDSKREAARYGELKLMKAANLILGDLIVHPRFDIVYDDYDICCVELDFQYRDKGNDIHYEDVKGKDNDLSRLKRKLVEAFYGIKVEIIK